ncbi:hypothetical protein DL93DRAFT_133636 [Clavulina sp. PMI_390]|nr:hypothetical protein DL93DRAFT_133636 [Clavulina sp. PMI_390]
MFYHLTMMLPQALDPSTYYLTLAIHLPESLIARILELLNSFSQLKADYPPDLDPEFIDYLEDRRRAPAELIGLLLYSVTPTAEPPTPAPPSEPLPKSFHYSALRFLYGIRGALARSMEWEHIDLSTMTVSQASLKSSSMVIMKALGAIEKAEGDATDDVLRILKPQLDSTFVTETQLSLKAVLWAEDMICEALEYSLINQCTETGNLARMIHVFQGPNMLIAVRENDYFQRMIPWIKAVIVHQKRFAETKPMVEMLVQGVVWSILQTLRSCMEDPLNANDLRNQALSCGIVPLLEVITGFGWPPVVDELESILHSLFFFSYPRGENSSGFEKALKQVHISAIRVNRREDLSIKAKKPWIQCDRLGKEPERYDYVEIPSEVCSKSGCETAEGAGLRCQRCGNRPYCSKACQVADWSLHKTRCRKK